MMTNYERLKQIVANHDGSRYRHGYPKFKPDLEPEEIDEPLPSPELVFVRSLDDYPLLLKLANYQIPLESLVSYFGVKHRASVMEKRNKRYQEVRSQFELLQRHPD